MQKSTPPGKHFTLEGRNSKYQYSVGIALFFRKTGEYRTISICNLIFYIFFIQTDWSNQYLNLLKQVVHDEHFVLSSR